MTPPANGIPSDSAPSAQSPESGKPTRKVLPLRQSPTARLALLFGIIAWVAYFYLHLVSHHKEPQPVPAIVLILSLATTFLCSLLILVRRFRSLLTRQDYPPIWPAIPALLWLLVPFIPFISVYIKSGGSVSYFLYTRLDRNDYELDRAMEITEARQLKEGAYLPSCPMSQRIHPPFDARQLPPDLASLPTFSMTETDLQQNDFTVHPGLRGNYFARKWGLPFSYFKADAQVDSTTVSGYIIWTCGPDEHYDLTGENIARAYSPALHEPSPGLIQRTYDPSNGALSGGDIYRAKFISGK